MHSTMSNPSEIPQPTHETKEKSTSMSSTPGSTRMTLAIAPGNVVGYRKSEILRSYRRNVRKSGVPGPVGTFSCDVKRPFKGVVW
jgi:hypothetical protein